jgi:hypothetical protein
VEASAAPVAEAVGRRFGLAFDPAVASDPRPDLWSTTVARVAEEAEAPSSAHPVVPASR